MKWSAGLVWTQQCSKPWLVDNYRGLYYLHNNLLVGGLEHGFYFSIYWEFHHPSWLSYFSEGLKPPTSYVWLGPLGLNSSIFPSKYPGMLSNLFGKSRLFKNSPGKSLRCWSDTWIFFIIFRKYLGSIPNSGILIDQSTDSTLWLISCSCRTWSERVFWD